MEEQARSVVVSRQFVFKFVNAALHGRSPVVIALYFQCGVAAIGDKNSKDVTGQINELAPNGRLVRLKFLAYHHKTPLGHPVPKFKVEFSDTVDGIDGLPPSDLIEPALEVTGQPRLAECAKIRDCSQMRINDMDPSKKEKGNHDEKHDRADKEEPRFIPADVDIDEGDEEKCEKTGLPPAMPPKV